MSVGRKRKETMEKFKCRVPYRITAYLDKKKKRKRKTPRSDELAH